MTRAEQAALKAYPNSKGIRELKGLSARPIFTQGYEQAEKDLALTWEDIRLICEIDEDMRCHSDWPLRGQEAYYEEVLRRFHETKNK